MVFGRGRTSLIEAFRERALGEGTSAQFIRFLLVGALNTLFGYSVFVLLYYVGLGVSSSLILATIAGVIFNFFTIGSLVFRRREWRLGARFALGYGLILGVNLLALNGLVDAGYHPAAGQAMLLPLVVAMSFLINKKLVFEK